MLSVGVLHDPNHVHLTILKQSMLLLQSLEVVLKQKLNQRSLPKSTTWGDLEAGDGEIVVHDATTGLH